MHISRVEQLKQPVWLASCKMLIIGPLQKEFADHPLVNVTFEFISPVGISFSVNVYRERLEA